MRGGEKMKKLRYWLVAMILVCPSCAGWQRQDNNSEVIDIVPGTAVAEVCNPPDQQQHLAVILRPQVNDMWCWAASGQMGMEFLGHNVSQCMQANNRLGRGDCCSNPTPKECNKGGWPEFLKYNFTSQHTSNTALSWDQLRRELADINPCGRRPVAFSWHWLGARGGGHMMVAIGYKTVDNVDFVEINDPWLPNVGDHRFITYDFYVQDPDDHSHWDDYYDIRYKGGN
jgi:hypothetical protein